MGYVFEIIEWILKGIWLLIRLFFYYFKDMIMYLIHGNYHDAFITFCWLIPGFIVIFFFFKD